MSVPPRCPKCHTAMTMSPNIKPHCTHCEAEARRRRDEAEENDRRHRDDSFSAPSPFSLDPFQTSTFDSSPSYDSQSYDSPSSPDTDFGGGGGFSGGGSSDTF